MRRIEGENNKRNQQNNKKNHRKSPKKLICIHRSRFFQLTVGKPIGQNSPNDEGKDIKYQKMVSNDSRIGIKDHDNGNHGDQQGKNLCR